MKALFESILSNVQESGLVVSSIWKASIKTMIKLLSYPEVVDCLTKDDPNHET
jgi:hypothetical protein